MLQISIENFGFFRNSILPYTSSNCFFLPGHKIFEENDQSLVKHVPALKDRAWLALIEQDENGTSYSLVCPIFWRN